MKALLFLGALLISSGIMARELPRSRLLLEDSKKMKVDINTQTVFCSPFGYNVRELKINIKALDGWTLFDHSNDTFDLRASLLPCMTAGECRDKFNHGGVGIEDVLQNNPRTEEIVVFRKVIELKEKTGEGKEDTYCARSLKEELYTIIGGVPFYHERLSGEQYLRLEACSDVALDLKGQ